MQSATHTLDSPVIAANELPYHVVPAVKRVQLLYQRCLAQAIR